MLVTRLYPIAAIALLALTGCQNLKPQASAATAVQPKPAKTVSATEQFLSNASAGSIATLSTSPWGDNVEITAIERYFAASGQTCLRLNIQRRAGSDAPALACKKNDGSWAAARLLTAQ